METAVLELLKRSAAIPSMPQVPIRFLEIVQDPDFDYREVVEVLSTDPGTTSEILRLANSSLFGVTRHVSSLPQALSLLGLRRVRSLVLGRYIVESIDNKKLTRINTAYFWRRSLTTAVLSGQFATVLEPLAREEAFISGLLADVGVIVLDESMPADYGAVADQYRPQGEAGLAAKEVALLGISHGQASALVLEHWQLPDIVCDAVRWHPWELEAQLASPLARIVGAADHLSQCLCQDHPDLEGILGSCRELAQSLPIDPATLARVLVEIEPQIEEYAEMLRIKVLPSEVYQVIAQGVHEALLSTQLV